MTSPRLEARTLDTDGTGQLDIVNYPVCDHDVKLARVQDSINQCLSLASQVYIVVEQAQADQSDAAKELDDAFEEFYGESGYPGNQSTSLHCCVRPWIAFHTTVNAPDRLEIAKRHLFEVRYVLHKEQRYGQLDNVRKDAKARPSKSFQNHKHLRKPAYCSLIAEGDDLLKKALGSVELATQNFRASIARSRRSSDDSSQGTFLEAQNVLDYATGLKRLLSDLKELEQKLWDAHHSLQAELLRMSFVELVI